MQYPKNLISESSRNWDTETSRVDESEHTVIGVGFLSKANTAPLVQGPTGVALGRNGDLYAAGTTRNHISIIPNALTRMTAVANGAITLSSGGWLNAPLGLTIAPNGDVRAMNANNGIAVEIKPKWPPGREEDACAQWVRRPLRRDDIAQRQRAALRQ
jgi:hypothetical protein